MKLDNGLNLALSAAAKDKSDQLGTPVTVAIADDHGCPQYLHRFDGAIIPSADIAAKKAYTAATLRRPTAQFGRIAQAGAEAFGINTAHPGLVIFGGGYPLEAGGETIGGVGVSGGSVAEDEAVSLHVLTAFRRALAARGEG